MTATPTKSRVRHARPAARVRPVPLIWWTSAAATAAVAAVGALLAGLHYTAELRLTGDRTIQATSGLALLASAACLSALVGRYCEPLGLSGLAAVCIGVAAFWLLLGPNKFAGPVILTVADERGVHLTDPLAGVPLVWAALLARHARSTWRART